MRNTKLAKKAAKKAVKKAGKKAVKKAPIVCVPKKLPPKRKAAKKAVPAAPITAETLVAQVATQAPYVDPSLLTKIAAKLTPAQARILQALSDVDYQFPGQGQFLPLDRMVGRGLVETTHKRSAYNGRTGESTWVLTYRRTLLGRAVAEHLKSAAPTK